MAQDQTKKEALFNEVKGSLFEYLVAKRLASMNQAELTFHQSLDKNYLNVLSQQDRMIRQFYPEMLPFLEQMSGATVEALVAHFGGIPQNPRLLGKFINSSVRHEFHEADLLIQWHQDIPVSLKLNKKNAYVNTKSGGIKSFFNQYFGFIDPDVQQKFNQLVDLEFNRMAVELHAFHDLEYPGTFSLWVGQGLSELPGELSPPERRILKQYYARLAHVMHQILTQAMEQDEKLFSCSLPALFGLSSPQILQVVCFHDFKTSAPPEIEIHTYQQLASELAKVSIRPFQNISSVELELGGWSLQIRIKPMNKFTTTAIKMNCSVKFRQPNDV